MKRSHLFLFIGFLVLPGIFHVLCGSLPAQEERRERRIGPPGGPGGWPGGDRERPPWMQGGPGGERPPWMQGGPGGDRGTRGGDRGGNDAERNERMLGMLRSMDTNRNGILEPNEIPEYRRGFVSMVVTRMGGDPNRRIDLNALARQASRGTGASTPQRRNVASSTTSSGTVIATDPLVPYFGEKEPDKTSILAFGQREPEAKTAVAAPQSASQTLSQSDQILRSAREIMSRYDKNKNGTLDKDKGEWVSSLPFKPDSADTNRDGRVSMSELIAALGGKSGATTGAAAVSTRQSMAYERIPPGMPDWFFMRDKDQDGQLTMLEYANGQPWTDAMVEEFEFLDRNNDGVATATEIFAALKEFDEKKKLQEELARREIERRKGAGSSTTPSIEGDKQPEPLKEGQQPGSPSGPPPTDSGTSGPSASPGPPGSPGPPSTPPTAPVSGERPRTEAGSIPTTGPYAESSSGSGRRDSGNRGGSRRGGYRSGGR